MNNKGIRRKTLEELKKSLIELSNKRTWKPQTRDYKETDISDLTEQEFIYAITYWNDIQRKQMVEANKKQENKIRMDYREKFVKHYDDLFAAELKRRSIVS